MYLDDQSGSMAVGHSTAWLIILFHVCCFALSWGESRGCLGLPCSIASASGMAGTLRLDVLLLLGHLTR